MYDSIIIGGGPAGLSASIYLARQKLEFAVLVKDFAGQVAWSYEVGNYLGFPELSGAEMSQRFREHVKKYNIDIKEGEEAKKISKKKNFFIVKTNKGEYETKTILVATGEHPRKLDVPGEKEFYGRGVAYCATCDAPLFKNKTVAVIGGGNSAMEAALTCNQYSSPVYVLTINKDLEGDKSLQSRIKGERNIKIISRAKTVAIIGDKFVTGLEYETGGKKEKLGLDGIFIEVGMEPNSGFIDLVKKNGKNEIEVDQMNMTNVPGIFAAGDVTNITSKQIIIATGEGAKAALSIIKYLQRWD